MKKENSLFVKELAEACGIAQKKIQEEITEMVNKCRQEHMEKWEDYTDKEKDLIEWNLAESLYYNGADRTTEAVAKVFVTDYNC